MSYQLGQWTPSNFISYQLVKWTPSNFISYQLGQWTPRNFISYQLGHWTPSNFISYQLGHWTPSNFISYQLGHWTPSVVQVRRLPALGRKLRFQLFFILASNTKGFNLQVAKRYQYTFTVGINQVDSIYNKQKCSALPVKSQKHVCSPQLVQFRTLKHLILA